MIVQHSIRTEFDRMRPIASPSPSRQSKYLVEQSVWSLKHRLNKRADWLPAIITKTLGSMVYEVQFQPGHVEKRHENQIRPRYTSRSPSVDLDSLPDNLIAPSVMLRTLPSSPRAPPPSPRTPQSSPQVPRYPTRSRKPPDRFTPSKHK